ncbi:hypothetical protein AMATHDRAFT_150543 [Amanita thiersii Skay4041]|uniref:Signal peptidase complex subunit 2 n=1 Tax=Amanita thiersii Skay4041 TaxID=703135 RepID=A0A2A9NAS6_9AGAR|nr:hypothetical protein AMATHDRAFT_150543 [Amanita thiersii Skay4041]
MARTPKKSTNQTESADQNNHSNHIDGGNGNLKQKQQQRSPSPALSPTAESERPVGPLSIVVSPEEREPVKVNNASLSELKNACDDALKRFLSRPELFKQIHAHTDIRLALGWLSVFVAGGTALYGYKIEFEKSKPVVWVGLILYCLLTTLQTLYAYFVQGDVVFVGKRKTFSKRIVTERIIISSRTIPAKKLSAPSSSSSSNSIPPNYSLSLTYHRSSSGGKTLLARGKTRGTKEYNAFFDEKGNMDQERFEKWVGEMVESAMEGKTS